MSDWMDAEQHADRAQEMYERGRWAEAEAELRKALALNPDQAEWHFNLGLTLEAAGRDSDALSCYERATELMPDQVEPKIAAGVVANRLGQHERAIRWFNDSIRVEPTCQLAYSHLMESQLQMGLYEEVETTFYLAQQATDEPTAHSLSVLAEALSRREQYEKAEWCLREALRLEPMFPRLRGRLAGVLAATGRSQQALRMYLRGLQDDPGSVETLLDYGELLMDMGRLPEAGEKFRRVLELEPANMDAHYRLGEIAMSTRRFEQAHLEFELVLKLDPGYPQVRIALGEAMLRRGRLNEALECLHAEFEQIEAYDQHQQARREARRRREREASLQPLDALAEPGANDEAVDDAPPADESEEYVGAVDTDMRRLADLLQEAGDSRRAARLYSKLIARDGESADLLRRLALARFQAGDRRGGVTASRRVVRLQPRCIISLHNLALAALEEKRLRIASGWIARGMAIDPHDDGIRRLRMRLWIAALGVGIRRLIAGAWRRAPRSNVVTRRI